MTVQSVRPATVLIVDDSPTMRAMIGSVLRKDSAISVVGEAASAAEARTAIKELNPDVVTLDIEMPNMNGLEFLEKIMLLRPMPVIMVSTLTQRGAEASVAALEIGAFDCVGKPAGGDRSAPFADLPAKVKAAAASVRQRGAPRQAAAVPTPAPCDPHYRPSRKVIAIGASTGGVEALIQVLSRFPRNCPPTVVTQHMPSTFTRSFAERLDRLCAPDVREAIDGAPLDFGRIYLAPGGDRHLTVANTGTPCCRLKAGAPVNGHCPSVDELFSSVAEVAGRKAIGAILTGMGRDGAQGLLKMRMAGAITFGQNERTSVVYGMPRVAFEIGAVEKQLPLEAIGDEIVLVSAAKTVGSV